MNVSDGQETGEVDEIYLVLCFKLFVIALMMENQFSSFHSFWHHTFHSNLRLISD